MAIGGVNFYDGNDGNLQFRVSVTTQITTYPHEFESTVEDQ